MALPDRPSRYLDYDNLRPHPRDAEDWREIQDAVVQLTKMGLNIRSPIAIPAAIVSRFQEVPVPRSTCLVTDVTHPADSAQAHAACASDAHEADLTNITPEPTRRAEGIQKVSRRHIYTPPSLQGVITTPGHLGGVEWHGASFDPMLNVMYVNANEVPTINKLRAIHDGPGAAGQTPAQLGGQIYGRTCAGCHGAERQGTPPHTPALVGLSKSRQDIEAVILQGRNGMPAFSPFVNGDRRASSRTSPAAG